MNATIRLPRISIGPTTIVGWLGALVGLVPIFAKAVQEGSGITVNGPEKWLAIAGVALLAITNLARYVQQYVGANSKIALGLTTLIGWLVGIAGFLPIVISAYGDGAHVLTGPDKYAALVGAVSLIATQLGRYLQSLRPAPVLVG